MCTGTKKETMGKGRERERRKRLSGGAGLQKIKKVLNEQHINLGYRHTSLMRVDARKEEEKGEKEKKKEAEEGDPP